VFKTIERAFARANKWLKNRKRVLNSAAEDEEVAGKGHEVESLSEVVRVEKTVHVVDR
jgi:hypothetical protein